MDTSWFVSLEDRWVRVRFNGRARIEFYHALATLLENRVLMNEALKELYSAYSEEGKKPHDPIAVVCEDCLREISGGKPLSEALSKWTNYQEVSLIAAGEKAGDVAKELRSAIEIINAKMRIKSAIIGATAYPMFLMVVVAMLLNMVATHLVPKFARVSDPASWEGAGKVLYWVAEYVTNFGLFTLCVLIVTVIGVFVSMPYLCGSIRVALDRLWPWSVYRMLHGSTFLLNVSVMTRAGVRLQDALETLARHAKPWLRERLHATLYGTGVGGNLGVALYKAGYDFPDRRAVRYLKVLASRDGFDETLYRYGKTWLEDSVVRLNALSKVMFVVGIVIVASCMILIVLGAFSLSEAIQAQV